jgi:hypothetical protein
MTLFALADRLNKTIEEIEQISLNEFYEWIAFYNLQSKDQDG